MLSTSWPIAREGVDGMVSTCGIACFRSLRSSHAPEMCDTVSVAKHTCIQPQLARLPFLMSGSTPDWLRPIIPTPMYPSLPLWAGSNRNGGCSLSMRVCIATVGRRDGGGWDDRRFCSKEATCPWLAYRPIRRPAVKPPVASRHHTSHFHPARRVQMLRMSIKTQTVCDALP
jgi:hypothetical protein